MEKLLEEIEDLNQEGIKTEEFPWMKGIKKIKLENCAR